MLGPPATVLGSLFVILGMGMGTIHFSLALSSLTREWLPSEAAPVVVLPRQGARLLFEERRCWRPTNGLKIGITYLGLRGGEPAFRLEVMAGGNVHRTETSATGSWKVLGPGGASLSDDLKDLRDRGLNLVLDIGEANPQNVRVKATSSLRATVEGAWDTSGVGLAGVLALADHEADLVGWILRQGHVTLSEAARHADQDEAAVQATLKSLVEQGLVREIRGGSAYAARLAPRRGRALPEEVWDALGQGHEHESPEGRATHRTLSRQGLRNVLPWRRGRFLVGAASVFVPFAAAEWMLFSGSGSFAGLLGFIGVIVVSLVAGIFPVLLLVASRRKGDRLPMVIHRAFGHPALLAGLYLVFLGSLLLHGLVIWEQPLLRAGALLVAAGIAVMTVRMVRKGTLSPRLNIELRDEQGRGTWFTVTANGRESIGQVTLEYDGDARYLQSAAAEIPAFSSLRRAVFEPRPAEGTWAMPRGVKTWVHRITADGDSEPISGSVTVQCGAETKRFDLDLARGPVTVPVTDAIARVDVELTEMREATPVVRDEATH